MSDNDRPELRAYRELETLVRHLGEELATFRRRALAAEAQVKDAHAPGGRTKAVSPARLGELETENAELRTRLDRAQERVRQMLDRVRFLRQQVQHQSPTAGAAR